MNKFNIISRRASVPQSVVKITNKKIKDIYKTAGK